MYDLRVRLPARAGIMQGVVCTLGALQITIYKNKYTCIQSYSYSCTMYDTPTRMSIVVSTSRNLGYYCRIPDSYMCHYDRRATSIMCCMQ